MKTTFSRIFFSVAIVLLVALLAVGTSFQALVRSYLRNVAMEDLRNDGKVISQLAAAYFAEGSLTDQDFLLNLTVASGVSDADAVICDARGTLVLCSGAPMGCSHQGMQISQSYLEKVLAEGEVESTGIISNLYDDPRYIVGLPITDSRTGRAAGVVILSTPLSETEMVMQGLSSLYLLISVIVVVLAIFITSYMAKKQSNPLRSIAKAATDFGHGDLDARAVVDSGDPQEVQDLALSFNNMAAGIQQSEYRRQEFVANVSHELKTPMTTISGYVDGILDGTIPPEKQKDYLRIVSDETRRLSRLVRSMLDISRLQERGGFAEEQLARFDVTETLGRTLIAFERKILEKGLEILVDMPQLPVYTLANEDAITQVLYNLTDNAVKFCPQGGKLELQVRASEDKVYVSVSNEGETIPPEELPLVFDRFHKLDKSRSREQEGWGLGLYIVKNLICSHGEDISVTSAAGKTEFTFTLPLVN